MAQPVWITPAGSLGTIPEGIFYQLDLLADTATIATTTVTSSSATTKLFTCASTAGLWAGLNVMFEGQVFGGVAAYERYFVYEIVDSTHFSIATFEKSTQPISIQTGTGSMTAVFAQHVYFYVQSGKLPPGIQCSDNGLLQGVPKAVASLQGVPYPVAEDVTSRFTIRGYTQLPVNGAMVLDRIAERTFSLTVTGEDIPQWVTPAGQIGEYFDGEYERGLQLEYTDSDLTDIIEVKITAGSLPPGLTMSRTGLISGFIDPLDPGFAKYDFEFIAEITDGKASNLRTFNILIWNQNALDSSDTVITSDNTFITADGSPVRVPVITNAPGSIGTVRNDNFFAYQFTGVDIDGDPYEFEIGYDSGDPVLPGLELDVNSGWLYGYIPNLGITERLYNFYIRIFKQNNPTVISDPSYFSLSIVGPVDTDITWLVPDNLGTIVNGSVSTLYVAAINAAGLPLQYTLASGSNSSLPQGLSLLTSGEIAGRVSFDTFALDLGTTTFDVTFNDLGITGINTETTFDMKHTFTVNATSLNGVIDIEKTFSITVDRVYNAPYQNLYVQAMPPEADRILINELLQNADIFQNDLLYRPADPNFGKATKVVYNHAFGLTSSTIAEYYSGLYKNHYWKNLTLGKIKLAQARNTAGEVLYEVIYSQVIDDLLNNAGESVSKEVTIPYPINAGDSTEIDTVYPNSLIDMRDQIIDTVGQVGTILPLWMTSKQANGRVLGFTPAWVIAYAKPGKGEQILYYINEIYGEQLNKVDFEVDRYEIDNLLNRNWDPALNSWIPSPPSYTTFDNNSLEDNISIWGNYDNNLPPIFYPVGWVNNTGNTSITWINQYNNQQTVFDGNSLMFIAPVDMYSNTQIYDKYLVFPKRNILG